MEESELLTKRIKELYSRAAGGNYFTFTDFLGLSEQAIFKDCTRSLPKSEYAVFGGASGAERIMVRFGNEEEMGYSAPFPISCIKIAPRSEKFADKLTHRDFLGSIMNLGIERSCLGDIVIRDNIGYLFCKEDIADYIILSLTRVKHTDVKLSLCDTIPDGDLYRTERRVVQTVGERLDAIVAKLFSLSRDEANTLFKRSLVFAEGRLITSNSYLPKEGERISVRGLGRFIFLGYQTTTKKGKLNIEVDLYV